MTDLITEARDHLACVERQMQLARVEAYMIAHVTAALEALDAWRAQNAQEKPR